MNSAFIAAMLILGLVTGYVNHLEKKNIHQIAEQKRDAGREFLQTQNLSSISFMKGSLDETKGKSGYGSALYARNYFADTWTLALNADHPNAKAKLVGASKVDFNLLPENLENHDVATIMKGKNQLAYLNTPTQVEIVKLNRDKIFQAWVRSVDILATRAATKTAPSSQMKARIHLLAPLPSGLDIQVKAPGQASFGHNFGSEGAPLPEGKYVFRLVGSGVIHYGQVTVDGTPYSVGLDPNTGAITHKANNILAANEEIGSASMVIKAVTSEDKNVNLDSCQFTSQTMAGSDSVFKVVHVSAKAFAVDGVAMETISIEKDLYMKVRPEPDDDDKYAKEECRQMCPNELNPTYDDRSDEERAKFLDLYIDGVRDPKKRDLFNPHLTDELKGKGVKGIICSNMDEDAMVLLSEHGLRPTELYRKNKEAFGQIEFDARRHVRWYAYAAPSCERKFVANRTECGCFAEDTAITMADFSEMPISELKVGDRVWNPQTRRPQAIARITAGPEKSPLLVFRVAGTSLKVTSNHPFLTTRGLLMARDVQAGDRIVEAGEAKDVEAIDVLEPDPANYPIVWNIALEGADEEKDAHFVLANGIMAGDLSLQESLQKDEALGNAKDRE